MPSQAGSGPLIPPGQPVRALSQFQALQQQKAQQWVTDITWVQCFSMYMAVLAKREPNMVPSMVTHLHTIFATPPGAAYQLVWLEYDIQFHMELAASADKAWMEGDPWQYVGTADTPLTSESQR